MVYWPKEEALLMKDSENAPGGVNSMAMPQLSTRLYHMSQNIYFLGSHRNCSVSRNLMQIEISLLTAR